MFWVDRLVLVARGRSSWWENFACDRYNSIFEEPPPEYAVLWSVAVGAAVAPVTTRGGSRFIVSFVVVGNAQTTMDCVGHVPVGTCHARWIIDSVRK